MAAQLRPPLGSGGGGKWGPTKGTGNLQRPLQPIGGGGPNMGIPGGPGSLRPRKGGGYGPLQPIGGSPGPRPLPPSAGGGLQPIGNRPARGIDTMPGRRLNTIGDTGGAVQMKSRGGTFSGTGGSLKQPDVSPGWSAGSPRRGGWGNGPLPSMRSNRPPRQMAWGG